MQQAFPLSSRQYLTHVAPHHDVRRPGDAGVEPNVQRLDLDLDGGRGVDEDPAGVVSVGSGWILKDAALCKQLTVAIC